MSGKVIGGSIVVLGAIATVGYFGATAYANHRADSEMTEYIQENGLEDIISYESVETKLFARDLIVYGVELTPGAGEALSIDRLSILKYDIWNDIPRFMHVVVDGMQVDSSSAGEGLEFLQELGYEDPIGRIEFEYDINNDGDVLIQFGQSVPEMGEFQGRIELADLDVEAINDFSPLALSSISLVSAELRYDDQSFMNRLFEYGAEQEDSTAAEIQENLQGVASRMFTTALPDHPRLDSAEEAVVEFIANPNALTISLQPTTPLAVAILPFMPQENIPEAIGLEVTAN